MNWFLTHVIGIPEADVASASEIVWRFASPWVHFWPVLPLAFIGLYFLYRAERGTASTRCKVFLGILRGLVLLVLALIIFKPEIVLRQAEEIEPHIVLLLDGSRSMASTDRYEKTPEAPALARLAGIREAASDDPLTDDEAARLAQLSRAELLRRSLQHQDAQVLDQLRRKGKLEVYWFDDSLHRASLDQAAEAKGNATAFGQAIREAAQRHRGRPIAALLLFSDGNHNAGISPRRAIEDSILSRERPFPVIPILVGDPRRGRDVAVGRLLASPRVLLGDPVVIKIPVSQSGFAGRSVPVELRRNGKLIKQDRRTLPEKEAGELQVVFTPEEPGTASYTVTIPRRPGERQAENNVSPEHVLDVVDKKIHVLLIAGRPSWDYRYLKNALQRDRKSIRFSCWLQTADRDFPQEGNLPLTALPADKEALARYHVVLLLEADPDLLKASFREALAEFVGDLGGGFAFGAGERFPAARFKGSRIEDILPVVLPSDRPDTIPHERPVPLETFPFDLTPQGREHPILRLENEPEQNRRVWQQLPGFYWHCVVPKLKPLGVALATHPYRRNATGKVPLLAVQFYGRGRTLFLAVDSTWRWRFGTGDDYFYRFWSQAIRFLSSGRLLGSDQRAVVSVSSRVNAPGDVVRIRAALRDELYRPIRVPQVVVQVEGPKPPEEELALRPVAESPGDYQATLRVTAPGRYRVECREASPPSGIGAAPVTFRVVVPDLEAHPPEARREVLDTIARLSGLPRAFSLSDLPEIPAQIEEGSDEILRRQVYRLWDRWPLFVLFALLIITEWAVRKRRMLA